MDKKTKIIRTWKGWTAITMLIVTFGVISFSSVRDSTKSIIKTRGLSTIETFTFSSNGTTTKGKIYLPDSYATNNDLPARDFCPKLIESQAK